MLKASVIDSSMKMMESDKTDMTFYFMLSANEKMDIERLKVSIKSVAKQVSVLSSKLVEGVFRDKWKYINEYDPFYEKKFEERDEEFKQKAYDFFMNLRGKNINLDKEPPFKVIILSNGDNTAHLIVLCIHHMVTDAMGMLEIIRLISDKYSGNKKEESDKIIKPFKGHYKVLKELNIKESSAAVKAMKPPKMMEHKQTLLPVKEEAADKNVLYSKSVSISEKDFKKIKQMLGVPNATVNDIMIYWTFLLIEKYNQRLDVPNQGMPISMKVDMRQYSTQYKDNIIVGNLFSTQDVFMESKGGIQLNKVINELNRLKQKPMGRGLYFVTTILGMLPVKLTKKIMEEPFKAIEKHTYIGISTTNIRKVDKYLQGMSEEIDDVLLIPNPSSCGFPSMAGIGVKGNIVFNFTKFNDKEGLVDELCNQLEEIIQSYLK